MTVYRKYSDYIILLLVILVLMLLLILFTDVHLAIIHRDVKEAMSTGTQNMQL